MNWLIIIILLILLFLLIYTLSVKQQQQQHEEEQENNVLQRCADIGGFGNVISDYCDKFYMCAGGLAIQLYCYSGFAYDYITGQCAHADTVDCQGRPFLRL
ncbi:nesp049 [Neophasia sp. alphabaculovirus]|nr:nesp049 [Neophasia sp. alphabaculovirus]